MTNEKTKKTKGKMIVEVHFEVAYVNYCRWQLALMHFFRVHVYSQYSHCMYSMLVVSREIYCMSVGNYSPTPSQLVRGRDQ